MGGEPRLPDGAPTIIFQHHETVDGSACPQDLEGGGIALPARIVPPVNFMRNYAISTIRRKP
ncbi:MAG: hypothetical protein LBQ62_02470 [Candidatus Accumulibacter sp.]|nr:hypothetical protein [Accumulibacter sp.]